MANPLGKTKKEDFNKKMAKEMAVEVAHKKNPLISKKKLRKMANKAEKKVNKRKGVAFG